MPADPVERGSNFAPRNVATEGYASVIEGIESLTRRPIVTFSLDSLRHPGKNPRVMECSSQARDAHMDSTKEKEGEEALSIPPRSGLKSEDDIARRPKCYG